MPPIRLNRRRFLGCSAAAGLALSQGSIGEGAVEGRPVRVGVIGLGTRGTSLLRALLEMPGAHVVSVCDAEAKHRLRGQGIVEKATGGRPEGVERVGQVLERDDVDAVVVALPCDLHAEVDRDAIRAGKHLYAEKPLALTVAACDMLIAEAEKAPKVVVHVGYQRRSNLRYRDGVALIHRGELGTLIEGSAAWVSSNGPMNGHGDWLARRARSGDWMVEQAVHVWDVFHWIAGGPPARAFGLGRRDLFADQQPGRDVTDHYSAHLEWADGFHVAFLQSWVAPADDRFTGITLQVMG
ncbi:MAG: Gfo/Idh/MocA family oxidoreductase, partial [Planctomycetaceae bacterium]|nr:Gfo/Idh/MocA family oxidoreductase [Planctomycetaceae bacterium]